MKNFAVKFKWIIIIGLGVVALCMMQYVSHYYSHPVEKQRESMITTGYLVLDHNVKKCEKVEVEIRGEELTYIFGNKSNAMQGDIWVNGQRLFGNVEIGSEGYGFYTEIIDDEYEYASIGFLDSDVMCKQMCISHDWKTIVCGIVADSRISETIDEPVEALLFVGIENEEEMAEQLQKVLVHPGMARWLEKNGWDME